MTPLVCLLICQLKQQQKTFNDSLCCVVTGLQCFYHLWLLHHIAVKYKCLLHYFTMWKPNFTNIAFKYGKYFRGFQGKHSWAKLWCLSWAMCDLTDKSGSLAIFVFSETIFCYTIVSCHAVAFWNNCLVAS